MYDLNYFLNNTNKFKIKDLPTGKVRTIKGLSENLIELNIPKNDTILKWHKLLLEYVNDEEAIFFIRRYASASNKNWSLIRRGFLTEYSSGLKYVFCDNYFAHYFFLMAILDYTPTYDEFKSSILNRKFPYGYMETSAEKPFRAFPKGKAVNINRAGWKLAHIYSVNQNDYNFNYKSESSTLFPRGEQLDWKSNYGNDYPSRLFKEKEPSELRKITIAHFLRLVHPINYFLVPKKSLSNYDIGEQSEVIQHMRNRQIVLYGKTYFDFEELILAVDKKQKNQSYQNFEIDFEYGFEQKIIPSKKRNNIISSNREVKIKPDDNYRIFHNEIIKAYLVDNKSHRTIEKEILGIESKARGGGFISKKILDSYGVLFKNKGTITERNINEKINNSSNSYKATLEKLKKFLIID